jgi:hypothetical protein
LLGAYQAIKKRREKKKEGKRTLVELLVGGKLDNSLMVGIGIDIILSGLRDLLNWGSVHVKEKGPLEHIA